MMSQPLKSKRQLHSVQFLRFVAAALVVAMHATQAISTFIHHADGTSYWHTGGVGVHIFFVISGFVMSATGSDLSGSDAAWAFIKKRLIRIVPTYWIYTTLKISLLLMTASFARLDWWHIAASFLFIPLNGPGGEPFPVLQVGWTLNYEMVFYAIFAISMLARVPRLAFCTVVICALFYYAKNHGDTIAGFYGRGIIFEFLMGMAVELVIRRNVLVSSKTGWLLMTAGSIALLAPLDRLDIDSALTVGIASCMLVYGAVCVELNTPNSTLFKRFSALGDASYSLYLVHSFFIAIAGRIFLTTQTSETVALLLLMIGSIACGQLAYVAVEKPISRFFATRRTTSIKVDALA